MQSEIYGITRPRQVYGGPADAIVIEGMHSHVVAGGAVLRSGSLSRCLSAKNERLAKVIFVSISSREAMIDCAGYAS